MSQTSFIKSNTLLRTTHSLTLRSGGYARRNIKQKRSLNRKIKISLLHEHTDAAHALFTQKLL